MDQSARFRGSLLGLAAGDAVGTTVEFCARGSFTPLMDMIGGGPFGLEPGQWTDDTSLALCLATSLAERDGFDAADQMARYCDWQERGYLSSTGSCFDIGGATAEALRRYRSTGDPYSGSTAPRSAGNGSLMRLAPVPIFFFPDLESIRRHAVESSRTTHAAPECLAACRLLAEVLFRAFSDLEKEEVLRLDPGEFRDTPRLASIAGGDYLKKSEEEIRSTGYVVHTLEAALWCFFHTGDFRSAILRAANLGDDADTTAAVCGQVAGAFYGEKGIPPEWLEKLAMRDEIRALADRLREGRPGRP